MASKCCKKSDIRKNGRVASLQFFHRSFNSKNVNGVYGNEANVKTDALPYVVMRGYVLTKEGEVVSNDIVVSKTIAYFECNYFPGLLVNDIVKVVDNVNKTHIFLVTNIEDQNFDNKVYKIQAIHDHTV